MWYRHFRGSNRPHHLCVFNQAVVLNSKFEGTIHVNGSESSVWDQVDSRVASYVLVANASPLDCHGLLLVALPQT